MKILVVLFALAFGLAWGVVQGMVMVQGRDARAVKRWLNEARPEGPRDHVWFGVYHLVCAGMMLLGLELVMAWDIGRPGVWWSLGCACLGWEMSEMGYSWARWAKWLPKREHLTAVDMWSRGIEGKLVMAVHAARVAAGVGCLILGGVIC